MTRAALKRAARMRATNIGTFRRRKAALKGWRKRRARIIRQREDWCLEQLRARGTIRQTKSISSFTTPSWTSE